MRKCVKKHATLFCQELRRDLPLIPSNSASLLLFAARRLCFRLPNAENSSSEISLYVSTHHHEAIAGLLFGTGVPSWLRIAFPFPTLNVYPDICASSNDIRESSSLHTQSTSDEHLSFDLLAPTLPAARCSSSS